MTAPPLVNSPMDIGIFLLANAIIITLCAPRFLVDLRRWRS